MGFVTKQHYVNSPIKATKFLLGLGYSKAATQRIIDKARLRQFGNVLQKKSIITKGIVEITEFAGRNLGLSPCVVVDSGISSNRHCVIEDSYQDVCPLDSRITNFATNNLSFCIFNKPAKLLTHPRNLNLHTPEPSLLEQLRYSFGAQSNPCHRLDYETSGLLLCSLDRQSEIRIKNLFLERAILKEYLAIVCGRVKNSILIESDIVFPARLGSLCIRGQAKNLKIQALDKARSLRDIVRMKQEIQDSSYSNPLDSRLAASLFIPVKSFADYYALEQFLQSNFGKKTFTDNIFSDIQHDVADTPFQLLESYRIFREKTLQSRRIASVRLKDSHTNNDVSTGFSLVRLVALTGKTHQLRIHANALRHSIVGDTLYGIQDWVASFFLDSKSQFADSNFGVPSFASGFDIEIFSQFLYYYQNLACHRNQILCDMRLYYTGNVRLLLHARSLKFLGKRFVA
ncbi:hypothetical protein CQA66_08035 [Helicobacter aurati]|uniref:RNA pseudouridylate synthase n=1 Tax=Helicobacter aurati TaxID=137778 RepID=A0A3D8J152_9HELI|nr:pseudouridine synthase [Helicobacter aurati]RDU70501.1 hypothetical protein CQA66_08035 [Helicobacter aurati]